MTMLLISILFGYCLGYITATNSFKKKYTLLDNQDEPEEKPTYQFNSTKKKKKESPFKKVFW